MSLEVIKELQSAVKDLTADLEASKNDAEAIRGEMKEALTERKTKLDSEVKYSDAEVAKAKKAMDSLFIQSKMLDRNMSDLKGFKEAASVIEKAVVPADITNWAAEEFSNSVIEDLELELSVSNLFKTITMPANRQTLSIPARTGDLSAYLIAPGAEAVASAITGGKVSFTVQKLMSYTAIADEADAELVAAVTDLSRAEIVRSLSRGQEDATINGDSAFGTPNSPKKLFDGLRKIGNTNSVDMGGVGITLAKIAATRKAMGIYGINTMDLALIVNPEVYFQLVSLPEFITVDKFGPMATVHTGSVGKIFGIDVMVSSYIANDLEAAGGDYVATGATTEALLVNKAYFGYSARAGVSLEKDRSITSQTNMLVGSRDLDFKKLYTSGTPIATLVNILP